MNIGSPVYTRPETVEKCHAALNYNFSREAVSIFAVAGMWKMSIGRLLYAQRNRLCFRLLQNMTGEIFRIDVCARRANFPGNVGF